MLKFGGHFQIIFEHSPVGMLILDFSGRILLSNKVVRSMVRKNAAEFHSGSFMDYISPEDLPEFNARFTQLIGKANSRFDIECRYLSEGGDRWSRLAMTHVGAGSFSPFIFGVFEDITNQKTGEEKLIREKETAEKATQTKSAFLANMSHEIRTPIHTVTGMTELLLETKLDEEQKEYADQIRYSSDVLLGLINDILDFSKIESGKLSLEIIECDLVSLFSEAVDMVSLLAHKKDLEVVMDLDRAIPRWVRGDPTRIRQILLNLFNNAVKFTTKGEIVIHVKPIHKIGGLQSIRIDVVDTGIGIAEDKLNLLFQAFTQVDSSTTRKYGGTGLGLSISKSFVQMMNGIIGVESVQGKGSKFWFTIPLEVIADREEEVEPVVDESVAGQRVLLVDDNRSARDVVYAHLTDWFRRVDTAPSGPQALKMLTQAAENEDPYHLVLVDLHLPGMDGWHLASEIKNNPAVKNTRLFLMSPSGSGTEAKMKLLGWFAGYLTKPIKRPDLLDCLLGSCSDSGAKTSSRRVYPRDEAGDAESRRSMRILVAEDHPVNQQLFRTILEKMGYTVLLANNGIEAVEHVGAGEADLVFMDVQMPEMNGYEASGKIRKAGCGLPIIAVTANALKGEREKCLAAGMDDFLTKPFKGRDLVPLLEKWMPKKPAPDGRTLPASAEAPRRPEKPKARPEEHSLEDIKIFDYPAALEAFMGKKDTVKRVVAAFRDRTQAQFKSMARALAAGDWKPLEIESHGIKGGSWNLHAKRLGDAAAVLEKAAGDKDAPAADAALSGVIREYEAFADCLSRIPDFKDG